MSATPILKDSFKYLAVSDPTEELLESFKVTKVPGIAGLIAATDESDQVQQFFYGGNMVYEELLQNMLRMSGKEEEFAQTKTKRKSKPVERRFEEITSQQKFEQNCVDKQKGCAIAFLTGNLIVLIKN